ncbi:MAG: dihydrofolate reductase [Paludibacteraceae bacterium]|nr:dihydrofolate reductase [Paludibacteraceae bacterium]
MLSIIVAIAENNAIGRKGELLCHLPADLKHFKAVTEGHAVIMGERTWLSLPKRPLPKRRNIVLTDVEGRTFEGAETACSIDRARDMIHGDEEAFIIGGGMVYRQFMPIADKLYITHIHHKWDDADTFFPEIEAKDWEMSASEKHNADTDNPHDFTFAEYRRRH